MMTTLRMRLPAGVPDAIGELVAEDRQPASRSERAPSPPASDMTSVTGSGAISL
jgi:hypothetical protein